MGRDIRGEERERWEVGRNGDAGVLLVCRSVVAGSFSLSLGKAIAQAKYSLAINIGS